MNFLKKRLNELRLIWTDLSSFVLWLLTIASTFILPLPSWGSSEEQGSITHFIIFLSTATAGFTLLLKKGKSFWFRLASVSLVLLVVTFIVYFTSRDNRTLPYNQGLVIIGTTLKEGSEEKLQSLGLTVNSKDLLMYVEGDPSEIWHETGIRNNMFILSTYLAINYLCLTIFIISFTQTLSTHYSEKIN